MATMAQGPPPPQTMTPDPDVAAQSKASKQPCPIVLSAQHGGKAGVGYQPLKLTRMSAFVECHVTTAFVTVECTVYAPTTYTAGDCVLVVPLNGDGTATDVEVYNGNKVYTTLVVPNSDLSGMVGAKAGSGSEEGQQQLSDPESFVLTFPNVKPGDVLGLRITWMQPLLFEEGKYKFSMPLVLPPDFVEDPSRPLSQYLTIDCAINTGSPTEVEYSGCSHPMAVVSSIPGQVKLQTPEGAVLPNADFSVAYNVWGGAISAACNVQPGAKGAADERSTFCLSISPPAPDALPGFPRHVVFVLDRSGSMRGAPMEGAKRAVLKGLSLLQPADRFTVVAFDHEQFAWSPQLQSAGPAELQSARDFVGLISARSLTDILTPLTMAFSMISRAQAENPSEVGVPYVFLVTDGAVENEREICRHVKQLHESAPEGRLVPRVSTFGIGGFCNHFFLRMLATAGRGLADTALRNDRVQEKMERMLVAAARPVLTQVELGIEGLQDVELYPFPVPDLFSGAPLVVSGKYAGVFPETFILRGSVPGGKMWEQTVHVTAAADIPLDKVFVKQRLDLMTAEAWLSQDQAVVRQVVELSVRENVPSAHTSMVGFETTRAEYESMKKQKVQGKRVTPSKVALGGLAAITVLGGVGAAMGFGDVAATMSNVNVGGALDAVGNLGGDAFGAIGNLADGAGDAICDCCGAMGGACGEVGEFCGDSFGAVGGLFSDCFSGIGDGCAECGSGIGECLGCVGEVAGDVASGAEAVCGACTGILSAFG